MRTCTVEDCNRKHYGRGLCHMHYQRATYHDEIDQHPRELVKRDATLDERLRHTGWTVSERGCWLWDGSLNTHGYGQLAIGSDRPGIASRVAYQAWVGPIPEGGAVCHKCDTPRCINPGHLFLGTRAVNNADMKAKLRLANGERHSGYRLTDEQVEEIRARYAAGGIYQRELADEYGVSQQLIGLIVRFRRRATATNPPLQRYS